MANKNLGNLLKIYRKNSLLTQQQVADALNPKEPFGQRSRRAPYKVPNTIISSSVAAI